MTVKKLILIAFSSIGIILLVTMIFYGVKFNREIKISDRDNPMKLTEILREDYKGLFNSQDKISAIETIESKLREPISDLIFDNKYYIEVYNIDTMVKSSLKDFIVESYLNVEQANNMMWTGDDPAPPFRITFKSLAPDKIESIYFNIYGDQTKTFIKNDTTAVYYSSFKNFNIKFNKGSVQEIYCRPNKVDSLPIVVAFLKKKERLYLIIVSPKTKAVKLNYDIIKDIIKLG
jgi:hypothetical protein